MKFSVVVPSFNQARFLEDCLESILMQHGVELEVLVMDGGSTDGSREIIERYASRLAYWRSEPDGGQSAAINEGFERASGDVLCWLCSDDYFFPGGLAHLAAEIKNGAEIVYGNVFHFDDATGEARLSKNENTPLDILYAHQGCIDQTATCFTREVWRRIGPLDPSLHYFMDWEWFLRALTQGAKFGNTRHVVGSFRSHEGHKTGERNVRRDLERAAIWKRHVPANWYSDLAAWHSRREQEYKTVGRMGRLSRAKGLMERRAFRTEPGPPPHVASMLLSIASAMERLA